MAVKAVDCVAILAIRAAWRCWGYLVCPETPLNSPDYQTRKTSLVSQGDNWIDVHGAAGGDVACDESDGGEQKRRADESKWVE